MNISSLPSRFLRSLHQPRHGFFPIYAGLVLVADALLCQLIISRIPFTEIDFATYLQQASQVFSKGERNYANIKGDSGPLVYPAGHVAFFGFMHWITDAGRNLWVAQQVFAALWSLTEMIVMWIFYRTGMPAWSLALLPLSKRLHSIYLLRCFNDPLAMLPLYAAVLASTYQRWTLTTLLFSIALSIKMNILNFLPALLFLCTLDQSLHTALRHFAMLVLTQILISLPFTTQYPSSYLHGAFNLHREFLYKWTVNWRFLPQDVFLCPRFWLGLITLHLALLGLFFLRWCAPHGGGKRVIIRTCGGLDLPAALSRQRVDPSYMASVWFCSNLIGILCARSLHYQFYSWYGWQAIFLVVNSPTPLVLKVALLVSLEICWNIYPSTTYSSVSLLVLHIVLLCATWMSRDFWSWRFKRAAAPRKTG